MNKTVYFVGVIVVVGLAAAWFWHQNTFSTQVLQLKVIAPQNAAAGDQITYTVEYQNTGNFVLQNAQLTFELPDNSLTADGKTLITQALSPIYPGDEESVTFTDRLLGKVGDVEVAKAALTYTPQNLSAQYESDATASTQISSVPVTLTYAMPQGVSAGQSISYTINYASAMNYSLQDLSVKLDPTSGFAITSSTPTSLDNAEWKIGGLNQGDQGAITINGTVAPNAGSSLHFAASLGVWQNGDFIVIQTASADLPISGSSTDTTTSAPTASGGLAVSQQVFYQNQDIPNSGPTPPTVGQTTTYTVVWNVSNSGTSDENNVTVSATLPGGVLLTGNTLPNDQTADISFDATTGQMVWAAGEVPAGTGVTGDPIELEFQIAFTPTANQQGSPAQLIGPAQISGTDAGNNQTGSQSAAVNTNLPDDLLHALGGLVQ